MNDNSSTPLKMRPFQNAETVARIHKPILSIRVSWASLSLTDCPTDTDLNLIYNSKRWPPLLDSGRGMIFGPSSAWQLLLYFTVRKSDKCFELYRFNFPLSCIKLCPELIKATYIYSRVVHQKG